jgi:3-phosphoshikimate 1-carboxyvinyltransferase
MTIAASQAIRPAAALRGTIVLPSDKSIAHRALICGAKATGESRIGLRQPGADVISTMGALRSVGVDIEFDDGVAVVAGREHLGAGTADCGNSGTSMRLLAGALASG